MTGTERDKMTTETEELQNNIKELIHRLGWSIPKLAEVIYTTTHDDFEYEENELKKFKDTLKHQLARKKTKPNLLKKYLDIISQDSDFKKNCLITPFYVRNINLNSSMIQRMSKSSKAITKISKSKNDL
jgi:hypothetical protein